MAIATSNVARFTSTAAPSLTPNQQAAREFWRQAGADGMPPFYVMSQYYAQLSANSDNLPVVTAALDQLLTGLGYATDVDTVFAELGAGHGEELGYWAGRYCLFDSDANRFDLVVGRNGATLTVPPALVDVTSLPAGTDMASVTALSGASFSDGVLQLANPQFQASLRFALPVSDASFDTVDPAAAMFQSTAPLCKGTFVVQGDGAAGLRPVNGKRGAWTQAGVNEATDGDPVAAWYGQYVLLDVTDVTAVKQEPEPVYIYNDPNFGLTFRWGDHYGGNVRYNNNVLQCANEIDDTTQYAMHFVAPQAGAAELNLAVTRAGVVRSYKGYWVDGYPPPRPVSQARLAKRPMTTVYSAAAVASGSAYSQAIDVSGLTSGGTNTILLPFGAVGNHYALALNLKGCVDTDKFSWTVTDNPTRATITPSGGANQTVQFSLNNMSDSDAGQHLQVTVQLSKTSAAPPVTYTLLFDIAVIQCDAITLVPTVLPPVVVGTAYTQKPMAYGAHGHFTWSVISSSLPPNLTWDPSSHQLSGTVTDATQVGKAFSLVLGLTASDVIMDALTTSLSITVQSGAAVASEVPPWAKILIYASPAIIALTGFAAFALRDFLKGKANAKTVEAVRAGNQIIEQATDGNPKTTGQLIVRAEDATIPSVEDKISYSEREVNQLREQGLKVAAELSKIGTRLEMLTEYVGRHPSDDPDNPVDDEDLRALGYEKYGQVQFDIPRWGDVQTHYVKYWNMIQRSINNLSATSVSDKDWLDHTRASESNDKHLLID